MEWLEGRSRAGASFRAPALSGSDASSVARAVRSAALEARGSLTTDRVIDSIAEAADGLRGDGPAAQAARELLHAELGWDAGLAGATLEGMARNWTRTALRDLVEKELGSAKWLDGFEVDETWTGPGQRRRRAVGPPLILQVLAGNVPGVAITATIRALVARSGVLCKLPEGEPGLLPLFARLLAAVDASLGRCVAATWWPGASFPAAWREWTHRAGATVVYGGDATLEAVRRSLPAHSRLIAYGPRMGLAVLLADARPGAAADLARDVFAYDQQGCVSPRLAYVVGGDAGPFARNLAAAMAERARDRPPPIPSDSEAVAIREARAAYEFGGYADGRSGVLAPGDSLAWTVLYGETATAKTEALPRVVSVHPVDDLDHLETVMRPLEGRIQAIGYAGRDGAESLADLGARLGASRVAPLGTIAWPPADWRHDGRHQLLPLLNWTDFEIGT
jgi:acyl-CoA reductase-like NAD-dependent aldehyde dehydrogenase